MRNSPFVFDTNTLVSAFVFERSTPDLALDKARGLGGLVASIETFAELGEVLLRPKLDKYLSLDKRNRILKDLKEFITFPKVTVRITACRDPKDNKFLELAVSAKAACIITGDKDLLVLHPFRAIPIVTPADFLNSF